MEEEGKRANYRRDRERVCERQSIFGEGDSGGTKILQDICINTGLKCNMINGMNDVDKVTVSVRQNDTSPFLVGDI
jgi:hypothetical protein